MILSKRRTGKSSESKRGERKERRRETKAVARGRVVHTSNACTRERAGPTFTAVNLSPFILYEAIRCFTTNGVRFESLPLCRSRAPTPVHLLPPPLPAPYFLLQLRFFRLRRLVETIETRKVHFGLYVRWISHLRYREGKARRQGTSGSLQVDLE